MTALNLPQRCKQHRRDGHLTPVNNLLTNCLISAGNNHIIVCDDVILFTKSPGGRLPPLHSPTGITVIQFNLPFSFAPYQSLPCVKGALGSAFSLNQHALIHCPTVTESILLSHWGTSIILLRKFWLGKKLVLSIC